MRYLSTFLLIFVMLPAFAQDKCSRETNFGTTEICLPIIKGYTECYTDEQVKAFADMGEVEANTILGFYLSATTYSEEEDFLPTAINDYWKVYGTNQISELQISDEMLGMIEAEVVSTFKQSNWDEIEDELEERFALEMSVPTMVKSYNLTNNSFTYLLIMNIASPDGEESIISIAMSGLLIKERLVWMAYYLKYEGKETIHQLEERSNKLVKRVLAVNAD